MPSASRKRAAESRPATWRHIQVPVIEKGPKNCLASGTELLNRVSSKSLFVGIAQGHPKLHHCNIAYSYRIVMAYFEVRDKQWERQKRPILMVLN